MSRIVVIRPPVQMTTDNPNQVIERIDKTDLTLTIVSVDSFVFEMLREAHSVSYFYKKFTDDVIDTVKWRKLITYSPESHEKVMETFFTAMDRIFNKVETVVRFKDDVED